MKRKRTSGRSSPRRPATARRTGRLTHRVRAGGRRVRRLRRGLRRAHPWRALRGFLTRHLVHRSRLALCAVVLLAICAVPLVIVGGCRSGAAPGGAARGGLAARAARTRAGRPAPLPMHRPVRAVWVARYHYRTPADVARIMDNCARLGCNTVLWQVRGECTVTYPSQIEPWGQEFGFRNPGFDPLALAIAEAHARGLRIEAWFNTLPGWRGATPPPLAEHTFHQHPDWFLQDAAGRRQPLTQDYVSLNPCLPEVRRHIMSVADEIAASYDIDGLHLDYVRYIWDGIRNAVSTYPYDARTVALFERETGRTPDEDPTGWLHWRANQLSRLVADIQAVLAHRRPGATLTAAVRGHPSDGYWQFLQNGVGWLRSGLVDAVMPMVYTSDPHRFRADVAAWHDLAGGQPVIPGLGIYKHNTAEPMSDQLACCATWGGDFALFSYESLCATSPGDRNASAQALRDMRCALLAQFGN